MKTIQVCPTCGEKISPSIGECLFCPPGTSVPAAEAPPAGAPAPAAPVPAAPPAAPPAPSAAAPPPAPAPVASPASPEAERERALGLLLFDAEESLARGHAEKALVSASRAVHDRPDSLTARALFERARRELLRGRRKGRLEQRLAEARRLLEAGDSPAAEKIVGAALKLVPDNAMALELFGRLKEKRLQAGTVEAEAERDLDRLARERARRSADAARAALAAGAELRALLTVRRALRLVPDDPDLLALLAGVQQRLERTESGRNARRAMLAQVRLAGDLVRRGEIEDSRKLLRAVLYEDPDFGPAQEGIKEAERALLERQRPKAAPPAPAAPAVPAAPPAPAPPPLPSDMPSLLPRATSRPPLVRPGSSASRGTAPALPPEIRIPPSRRATPWGLVLGCGVAIVIGSLVLLARGDHTPAPPVPAAPSERPAVPPAREPAPETGPLAATEPALRTAIEATLDAYAHALEAMDDAALAAARPDLSGADREAMLAPFRGALNVATDLRVLDVVHPTEDLVEVPVLRTDVIVGGHASPGPPVEETLRFERTGDTWALKGR